MGIEKRVAYTFTGQGSQRIGMWDDLKQSQSAQKIFQLADEITRFPLSKLCSEGPLEVLTKTSNAQPAIVAHSLAALAVFYELHPQLQEVLPSYCLGHSVGEYAALAAAGAIKVSTAVYLARQRGLLMEEFGKEGKMAALIGFRDQEEVSEICQQTGVEPANFNGPTQIVISGGMVEMQNAIEMAKVRRIKAIPLQASHPFHSSLMQPVQSAFQKVVASIELKDPKISVISNVTAKPFHSVEEIKIGLVEQITAPVRWADSIKLVQELGVSIILEFGPKPVLTGLLNRISPEARGFCVYDYNSARSLNL